MKTINENELDFSVETSNHDYHTEIIEKQLEESKPETMDTLDGLPTEDLNTDTINDKEDDSNVESERAVPIVADKKQAKLDFTEKSNGKKHMDEKESEFRESPFEMHYYASLTRRLGAFLIDLLMITAITWIVNTNAFRQPIIVYFMTVAIHCSYFASLTYLFKGQTIGKMIVGIRTVTIKGEFISFKEVFYREIVMRSIHRVYGFLYLFAIFSKERQQLGDKVAETCVIKE